MPGERRLSRCHIRQWQQVHQDPPAPSPSPSPVSLDLRSSRARWPARGETCPMHSGVTGVGTWRGSQRGNRLAPEPVPPAPTYSRAHASPSRSARPHWEPSLTSSSSGTHRPKTLLLTRNPVISNAKLAAHEQPSTSGSNRPRFSQMSRRRAETGLGGVRLLNFVPLAEGAVQMSVTRQTARVDVPKGTYFVCVVTRADGPVVRNCLTHDTWKPSPAGTRSPCSWSENLGRETRSVSFQSLVFPASPGRPRNPSL